MNVENVKLGDAATFVNGYPFKPTDWSDSGKEIIRIQNLTKSSSNTNFFEGEIAPRYSVQHGDLLISWSGTLGVYEWKGDDAWLNQHIFKVVFNKREIDKRFFKYLIESKLHELERQVHGATMKHITKAKFDEVPISLPSLSDQRQIADTLDRADALRQKDQELLQKYDELAQSIFYEMFGDPVRNERGVRISALGECVKGKYGVKAGPFGSALKKEYYVSEGYKIYGQEQVIADDFEHGDYYISEEKYRELEACKIEAGDVLISMVGTYGKVSVVPATFHPGIINPRLVKISFDQRKMLPAFFKFMFQLPETKKMLSSFSRGGTMDIINAGILKQLPIPVPPIDDQHGFLQKLEKVQTAKSLLRMAPSDTLFNSLLSRYFS